MASAILTHRGPTPASQIIDDVDIAHADQAETVGPPPSHALFPYGNLPEAPPADLQEPELREMIEARGTKIETELVDSISALDRRLQAAHRAFVDSGDVQSFIVDVSPLLDRRRALAQRLRIARRILGSETPVRDVELPALLRWMPGPGSIPEKIQAAKVRCIAEHDLVVAQISAAKQLMADDTAYFENVVPPNNRRRDLAHVAAVAAAPLIWLGKRPPSPSELASWIETETGKFSRPHVPYPHDGPQNIFGRQLADLVRQRIELENKIAELDRDKGLAVTMVTTRVKTAVKLVKGGAAKLAEIVADAQITAKLYPPDAAPLAANLNAIATERDENAAVIERELTRNGIDSGPQFEFRMTLAARIVDRFISAKNAFLLGTRGIAVSLVDRAIEGDEAACAELEQLVGKVPADFPRGFGQAIAGAKLERALLEELAEVIS